MKKILIFFVLIFSLCFCFNLVHADSEFEITNSQLNIECADGEIVVSGSFDSSKAAKKSYVVLLATYSEGGHLIKLDVSSTYPNILEGTNNFILRADVIDNVQITKAFVWAEDMIPICTPAEKTIRSLKVLAIGNSFSVDAMQWLYDIAKSQGIDNVVLGNVYAGSCSVAKHRVNATNNNPAYTYYKNTTGTWETLENQTLYYCLTDENWNLITMQQSSGYSGMAETFEPYLTQLVEYVNQNKTNPYAKLAWHQTWAYAKDSTHKDYSNYNKDQLTMYNAIVNAVKQNVETNSSFSYYIPSGSAIQNARTSIIGDNLTRDGYHLDYTLGRYIAGLTWFHKITGLSIDDVTYVPDKSSIPSDFLEIVKESVKNAVLYPDKITQSKYTDYNWENYNLLDWEPTVNAFYNSKEHSNIISSENSTSTNLPYYVASKIFTKEELPTGTLIVIDKGYQYRPEAWTSLDALNTNATRPGNVTTNVVRVNDNWWGNFNFRAFNVAVVGAKTDITNIADEVINAFRIYIPKT